jgi:DNA-binding NarL/FixJ family response regulator
MNSTREVAEEALRAGASAYVLKNARCSELIQAIEGALRGRSYVSPHVRRAMAAALIRNPRSADRPMHLTNRQVEVLQMFAEGLSLKEIADALQISYRTVRFHKFGIMEELGIQTNSELVQYAMKRGMISSV